MIEVIRALSQRVEALGKGYEELQSLRSLEAGREARARQRVQTVMRNLPPLERDVAHRVLKSIFSDGPDEGPEDSGVSPDFVSRPLSGSIGRSVYFFFASEYEGLNIRGYGRQLYNPFAPTVNIYIGIQ